MASTSRGFLILRSGLHCPLWHRRPILSIQGLHRQHRPLLYTSGHHPASITSAVNMGTASSSGPGSDSQAEPTLLIQGDKIISFPSCSQSNFSSLRNNKHFAYFDRTKYISILDSTDKRALLFLRPCGFGKSLTLSMLEHFHSVRYKVEYDLLFKDLDVDKDVKENRVKPGEYLVLSFNFSAVRRSQDPKKAAQGLADEINESLERFYRQNHPYFEKPADKLISGGINKRNPISSLNKLISFVDQTLRESKGGDTANNLLANVKGIYLMVDEYDAFSNEYMDPYSQIPVAWARSDAASLLKDFWATVKCSMEPRYGICKCFITGISPLSLVDNTSGFNIALNISFDKKVAGLCGLTSADIMDSLHVVCNSKVKAAEHLAQLTKYANGYHFCQSNKVEPVFNTNISLEYLQAVLDNKTPQINDPPNSEVSETFLCMCAGSPVAINDIETALMVKPDGSYNLLPYRNLVHSFNPFDLNSDITGDGPDSSWQTLLLYFGGFTFDKGNPSKYLIIPNFIEAKRFGTAILRRFKLLGPIQRAIKFLASRGNIKEVLACYRILMAGRDVGASDFNKIDRNHRDSLFGIVAFTNRSFDLHLDYKVTKPNKVPSRIDLVELPQHIIVMDWRVINIDFLIIEGFYDRGLKAKALSELDVDGVLKLKFNTNEKGQIGTIEKWIKDSVAPQLQNCVMSAEVKELRGDRKLHAHLVLIVGSRQILVWDMDEKGNWVGGPALV